MVDSKGQPIVDENGDTVKVFIRVIGDNDMDTARRLALRYSKLIREDYEVNREELTPTLDQMDTNQLVDLILVNNLSEFYRQAERDTELNYPRLNLLID